MQLIAFRFDILCLFFSFVYNLLIQILDYSVLLKKEWDKLQSISPNWLLLFTLIGISHSVYPITRKFVLLKPNSVILVLNNEY